MGVELRVIISGGGTGGHIFPAVSIANAIKAKHPEAKILFVGALGRMKMQRVPAAGYDIKGLPVAEIKRKNLFKNIPVLIKLFKSQYMAKKIIKEFKPQVAVGVGGYASGPTLKVAGTMGIPSLIQEQNSYAGVTNKLLAKKASKICVAYEGMERFFDKEKIILTGNPVRQGLFDKETTREEAIKSFGLNPNKKTILVIEIGRAQSELQSPDHLVCRLLLEKKKKRGAWTRHNTRADRWSGNSNMHGHS